MTLDTSSLIIGVTPFERPTPALVVALLRARALGVLDLGRDAEAARAALREVCRRTSDDFGVRIAHELRIDASQLPTNVRTVLVTDPASIARFASRRVLVEVTSLEAARAAVAAGASGIIAKGAESGGRVGDTSSFVLLQQIVREIDVPVWCQGGIGLHTAAAAVAGGACGVVLDAQLALAREVGLPRDTRAAIAAMDGSETTVLGEHRVYTRPDLPVAKMSSAPLEEVAGKLGVDLRRDFLPIGQDGGFAGAFAERFKTAGGIVHAIRGSIESHIRLAKQLEPLAPEGPFAREHAIAYPIAQGPMTRVSDRAEFARAVADGGGLPFLALALMSGDDVRALLAEAAPALEGRAWGVGILGFVPPEIRDAQLEVVREFKPPVALIAGGRPAQARALEDDGIVTYLHVPSPGLLTRFLKEGGRRFVFEGRECGGHVGPRSSFALWESQIDVLLGVKDASELSILFAGGIHDARSAAMVAAAAAPLAERGAKVGVLMGSAYILTTAAVECGAIQPTFQEQARACATTVLLETSPGHAVRVLDSPYVEQFNAAKRELEATGASPQEIWADLEERNLGRLRIASKGLRREGNEIVSVEAGDQLRDGMFMIGQVATMRSEITTIEALHDDVSAGGTAYLRALAETGEVQTGEPIDIAIVGMSGIFAGAPDVEAFWSNIVHGVDSITEVPPERWDVERYYDPTGDPKLAGVKTPCKWGGFLPETRFDALSYGIPPNSLTSIEPVQLLALEVARRALADAGYEGREFDRARTSVIFGAEAGTDLSSVYGFRALFPQYFGEVPDELDRTLPKLTEDSFPGILANVIAGRIANRLDLRGINCTTDAACAASLAAVYQAAQELRSGSSDMVLCGGADLHNGIHDYLMFSSVHALSRKGRCRTFDTEADGIVLGEGVACVVLKRLEDAERDGDRIYAVLKGIGGSSDGRHLGLTAPRPEGQQLALRRAYAQANVSPAEIGLVEAHGTGTVVGDRAELETLTKVYASAGAEPGRAALGSVKSQIGHTKCTAGVASLIKLARSVHAGVRPATLHLRKPTDYYDADTSPFHFGAAARPWADETRKAALSSFGFGGSNFHAVIEAYTGEDRPERGLLHWPAELVLLRGSDRDAAEAELDALEALLDAHDRVGRPARLRDVAATVSTRGSGPVQIALVAESLDDLRAKLDAARSSESSSGIFVRDESAAGDDVRSGKIAFVFPGQGSQRPGMLADLFVAFPRLQHLLALEAQGPDLIFPPAAFTTEGRAAQKEAITDTRAAQPSLGRADVAMAELLAELGVTPQMAAGHSYGELAALSVAGAFGSSELLHLSSIRAEAILEAAGDDPGSMAAVEASADEIDQALDGLPGVVLANDNAPAQMVISGPSEAIELAIERLERAGLSARRIPVACAFHSPVVAGASEKLGKHLAEIRVAPLRFPVWSNTTATAYPNQADVIRTTLAEQVARPVRFRELIEDMYANGARIFVEAGPGRVLSGLVKKILGDRPHCVVCCDVPGEPGIARLLQALAQLAVFDVELDREALFERRDQRPVDIEALRKSKAHYVIDGHSVRSADGSRLPGGLFAANQLETLSMGGVASGPSTEADLNIELYLKSMRDLVEAQRDVMLGYLGAERVPRSPVKARAVEVEEVDAVTTTAVVEPDDTATEERGRVSGEALMQTVLGIVSERTGYPLDMLEPDLDLEADLSIDSIKRVEILGELAERVELPGADADELGEEVIEELARLKTLRQIVEWIDSAAASAEAGEASTSEPAARATGEREGGAKAPAHGHATAAPAAVVEAVEPNALHVPPSRYRFELEELPALTPGSVEGRAIVVRGGSPHLREALSQQIGGGGGELRGEPDAEVGDALAVLHLAGLAKEPSEFSLSALFDEVRASVAGGAKRIIVATPHGGSFGMDLGKGRRSPKPQMSAAGVLGMVRTFACEFPEIQVRCVDLSLGERPEDLARHLLCEATADDSRVEIGMAKGVRRTLRLAPAPLGDQPRETRPRLDGESVLLVTGGARGIGARSAIAFARAHGCQMILLGRSPLPEHGESPDLAAAHDPQSLRRAIIAQGELRKPAEIEARLAKIQAAREIRNTLAALAELGVDATYRAVDVRDADALAEVIREIYQQYGRLDGVVHAAGVIEDKLIPDKTLDSFDRVVETKLAGMRAFLTNLRLDVQFILAFGSVSGAFGNRGQVDYSAANEALALMARALDREFPARVVTIDWGPWGGGGMVTPDLEREYQKRGVALIDPDAGVKAMLDELCYGDYCDSEVVLMPEPSGDGDA